MLFEGFKGKEALTQNRDVGGSQKEGIGLDEGFSPKSKNRAAVLARTASVWDDKLTQDTDEFIAYQDTLSGAGLLTIDAVIDE